jgi:hypothetical protein
MKAIDFLKGAMIFRPALALPEEWELQLPGMH